MPFVPQIISFNYELREVSFIITFPLPETIRDDTEAFKCKSTPSLEDYPTSRLEGPLCIAHFPLVLCWDEFIFLPRFVPFLP